MTLYPQTGHERPAQQREVITSLWRGLQILELLAAAPEGLIAKAISARSGLKLSTCYHLLNTLVDAGYVAKPDGSQRFSLSGKVAYPRLARVEGALVVPQLLPHLQALRDETREAAYLAIRSGDAIVIGAIVDGPQALRVAMLYVGYDQANHATALGKAVLAHLDDYDVTEYLARNGMPALTANTITSTAQFKRELAAVRERGYSLDLEELAEGVCCIGAPIFDAAGRVVASLGIPLPVTRYQSSGPSLARRVQAAGLAATRALGLAQLTGPPPEP